MGIPMRTAMTNTFVEVLEQQLFNKFPMFVMWMIFLPVSLHVTRH